MNCYTCVYRASAPGSAHSTCKHPYAQVNKDPMAEVFAIFASVGRGAPGVDIAAAKKLNIKADSHGVSSGWFNWPYDFDPVWLRNCEGYKEKP